MNISDRIVSAELEIALIAPDDVMIPLIASLHYTPSDPYAVRMAFHTGVGEPNEWTFSRDLLADGLLTCAGAGDVQIWPSAGHVLGVEDGAAGRGVVNVQLSSPSGSARFRAPADGIAGFLGRTYQLVGLGEESAAMDIEAELAGLLGQA